MSRIADTFGRLRSEGRPGLVTFTTAGDPDLARSGEILKALDQLPANYRQVVMLTDVEEFDYKEAAEILSIPIGTIMSRLSRGRRLLREALAGTARSYGIGKTYTEGQGA